ncbi:MAG: MoxR family ATPase [Spirochaetales bacterium]|nr:MoxR family ATPase [Spirochaetales bacterium]
MSVDNDAKERIAFHSNQIKLIKNEISKLVVGQEYMIDRLLVSLICDSHVLLEGVPGLAKTLSVTSLAAVLSTGFKRIQFTPDLLPSDLLGTMIYNQKSGDFSIKKGPLFSNIILADEINRAPAKVQSALLEAMQEKQISIGDTTFPLSRPYMVLATQNPIDQEGTYPLPEAQVDRFLMKLNISYPSKQEELAIIDIQTKISDKPDLNPIASEADILEMNKLLDSVFIDDSLKEYVVDLVRATRKSSDYGLALDNLINFGASPRAIIALIKAAKAFAIISGRDWVSPEDLDAVVYDVLRHRIILSYEALAQRITVEEIISEILKKVKLV